MRRSEFQHMYVSYILQTVHCTIIHTCVQVKVHASWHFWTAENMRRLRHIHPLYSHKATRQQQQQQHRPFCGERVCVCEYSSLHVKCIGARGLCQLCDWFPNVVSERTRLGRSAHTDAATIHFIGHPEINWKLSSDAEGAFGTDAVEWAMHTHERSYIFHVFPIRTIRKRRTYGYCGLANGFLAWGNCKDERVGWKHSIHTSAQNTHSHAIRARG